MDQRIGILTEELLYSQKLADAFAQRAHVKFCPIVFQSREQLEHYIWNQPLALLLVDEALNSDFQVIQLKSKIVLVNQPVMEPKLPPLLYKYQPVDHIIQEAEAYYFKCNPSKGDFSDDICGSSGRIGIYSPIKRCMKTLFSYALSRRFTQEGSVLFISLEEYSPLASLLGLEVNRDLSDVLYLWKQGQDMKVCLEDAVVRYQGVDLLLPAGSPGDIWAFPCQELSDFLRQAHEQEYTKLILDLGDCLNDPFQVLRFCDLIFMPTLEDRFSQEKIQIFQRYAALKAPEILQKIKPVQLPDPTEIFKDGPSGYEWGDWDSYFRTLQKDFFEG